jgi:hypothetical protein
LFLSIFSSVMFSLCFLYFILFHRKDLIFPLHNFPIIVSLRNS